MTISLRLSERDGDLFKRYADMNGISVSELVRQSVLSRIEDEFDLQLYDQALAEYRDNPVTYSLADVEKELGLR